MNSDEESLEAKLEDLDNSKVSLITIEHPTDEREVLAWKLYYVGLMPITGVCP